MPKQIDFIVAALVGQAVCFKTALHGSFGGDQILFNEHGWTRFS